MMKWWVGAMFIALLVGWLAWTATTQEYRITQLECALAQAHAEADTLEALLAGRYGESEK